MSQKSQDCESLQFNAGHDLFACGVRAKEVSSVKESKIRFPLRFEFCFKQFSLLRHCFFSIFISSRTHFSGQASIRLMSLTRDKFFCFQGSLCYIIDRWLFLFSVAINSKANFPQTVEWMNGMNLVIVSLLFRPIFHPHDNRNIGKMSKNNQSNYNFLQ